MTTDCEGTGIHDETSIAANPASPANLIGAANDYQIRVTNGVGGGPGQVTVFTRAHVSFDSGQSWAMYPVPAHGYSGTGDPAVAFDAAGTAYLATLGSTPGLRGGFQNPDILVAHSTDGGKT